MSAQAKPVCSIDGCNRPNSAHGLCAAHALRKRRGIDLGKPITARVRRYASNARCRHTGCDAKPESGGYCPRHYMRKRISGTTAITRDTLRDSQIPDEWKRAIHVQMKAGLRYAANPANKWQRKVHMWMCALRARKENSPRTAVLTPVANWNTEIRRMIRNARSRANQQRMSGWKRWVSAKANIIYSKENRSSSRPLGITWDAGVSMRIERATT